MDGIAHSDGVTHYHYYIMMLLARHQLLHMTIYLFIF